MHAKLHMSQHKDCMGDNPSYESEFCSHTPAILGGGGAWRQALHGQQLRGNEQRGGHQAEALQLILRRHQAPPVQQQRLRALPLADRHRQLGAAACAS